jgi:hypothetical protein
LLIEGKLAPIVIIPNPEFIIILVLSSLYLKFASVKSVFDLCLGLVSVKFKFVDAVGK